jgi:hypothetical protein
MFGSFIVPKYHIMKMYRGMTSFTVWPKKEAQYPLDKGTSGPQTWFGHNEKQRNPYPCWKLNLRHAACNHSLY